ncbi:MAG: MATE family efflux transporter [Woeseia sp.]|nr:MATE family efflux transporter [Woeseia sp.]
MNASIVITRKTWQQEVAAMLRIAGPLIINNLAIAGMQFADAVMAGQLGAKALASVAVGASVWFLGFTLMLGLMMAISPIAARHFGAGDEALIGRYTRHGLWLALIMGIGLFAFAKQFAGPALTAIGVDAGFRDTTVEYVHAIMLGAPAICGFLAFRFTTEGIGRTRPIMYTSIFALLANVFLNWVLMFGNLGAPALGAVGAGYASAITMWLIFFILGAYIWLHPFYKSLEIFTRFYRLRPEVIREIVTLGWPISITITAEAGLFSAVSVLMGTRGAEITAAHQIALNFASTMFMVPLALSSATTIRIGHALGALDNYAARFSGIVGIVMSSVFMAASATFLLVFRDAVVDLYTNDPAVQRIAISLLLMAAVFQVADGVQIGAAGALRGYKDTRLPMAINMFAYWVLAFPLAYMAAVVWVSPPSYIWGGFVLGLSVAAILLSVRFNRVSREAL